ncbi:MAG: PQQ-binding-like beta-propeller repeat protein, partial [Planctomycetota bacterium]
MTACSLLLMIATSASGQEVDNRNDWPSWRGARADGVADGRKLPLAWSATRNVLWSVALPGWGNSSPVVRGNKVFVTTHVRKPANSLLTICLDRDTGKELWRHDFGFGVNQRTHEKSSLAVNTPTATSDALYVA